MATRDEGFVQRLSDASKPRENSLTQRQLHTGVLRHIFLEQVDPESVPATMRLEIAAASICQHRKAHNHEVSRNADFIQDPTVQLPPADADVHTIAALTEDPGDLATVLDRCNIGLVEALQQDLALILQALPIGKLDSWQALLNRIATDSTPRNLFIALRSMFAALFHNMESHTDIPDWVFERLALPPLLNAGVLFKMVIGCFEPTQPVAPMSEDEQNDEDSEGDEDASQPRKIKLTWLERWVNTIAAAIVREGGAVSMSNECISFLIRTCALAAAASADITFPDPEIPSQLNYQPLDLLHRVYHKAFTSSTAHFMEHPTASGAAVHGHVPANLGETVLFGDTPDTTIGVRMKQELKAMSSLYTHFHAPFLIARMSRQSNVALRLWREHHHTINNASDSFGRAVDPDTLLRWIVNRSPNRLLVQPRDVSNVVMDAAIFLKDNGALLPGPASAWYEAQTVQNSPTLAYSDLFGQLQRSLTPGNFPGHIVTPSVTASIHERGPSILPLFNESSKAMQLGVQGKGLFDMTTREFMEAFSAFPPLPQQVTTSVYSSVRNMNPAYLRWEDNLPILSDMALSVAIRRLLPLIKTLLHNHIALRDVYTADNVPLHMLQSASELMNAAADFPDDLIMEAAVFIKASVLGSIDRSIQKSGQFTSCTSPGSISGILEAHPWIDLRFLTKELDNFDVNGTLTATHYGPDDDDVVANAWLKRIAPTIAKTKALVNPAIINGMLNLALWKKTLRPTSASLSRLSIRSALDLLECAGLFCDRTKGFDLVLHSNLIHRLPRCVVAKSADETQLFYDLRSLSTNGSQTPPPDVLLQCPEEFRHYPNSYLTEVSVFLNTLMRLCTKDWKKVCQSRVVGRKDALLLVQSYARVALSDNFNPIAIEEYDVNQVLTELLKLCAPTAQHSPIRMHVAYQAFCTRFSPQHNNRFEFTTATIQPTIVPIRGPVNRTMQLNYEVRMYDASLSLFGPASGTPVAMNSTPPLKMYQAVVDMFDVYSKRVSSGCNITMVAFERKAGCFKSLSNHLFHVPSAIPNVVRPLLYNTNTDTYHTSTASSSATVWKRAYRKNPDAISQDPPAFMQIMPFNYIELDLRRMCNQKAKKTKGDDAMDIAEDMTTLCHFGVDITPSVYIGQRTIHTKKAVKTLQLVGFDPEKSYATVVPEIKLTQEPGHHHALWVSMGITVSTELSQKASGLAELADPEADVVLEDGDIAWIKDSGLVTAEEWVSVHDMVRLNKLRKIMKEHAGGSNTMDMLLLRFPKKRDMPEVDRSIPTNFTYRVVLSTELNGADYVETMIPRPAQVAQRHLCHTCGGGGIDSRNTDAAMQQLQGPFAVTLFNPVFAALRCQREMYEHSSESVAVITEKVFENRGISTSSSDDTGFRAPFPAALCDMEMVLPMLAPYCRTHSYGVQTFKTTVEHALPLAVAACSSVVDKDDVLVIHHLPPNVTKLVRANGQVVDAGSIVSRFRPEFGRRIPLNPDATTEPMPQIEMMVSQGVDHSVKAPVYEYRPEDGYTTELLYTLDRVTLSDGTRVYLAIEVHSGLMDHMDIWPREKGLRQQPIYTNEPYTPTVYSEHPDINLARRLLDSDLPTKTIVDRLKRYNTPGEPNLALREVIQCATDRVVYEMSRLLDEDTLEWMVHPAVKLGHLIDPHINKPHLLKPEYYGDTHRHLIMLNPLYDKDQGGAIRYVAKQ